MVTGLREKLGEMHPKSKQELKQIRNANNSLQADSLRSVFYFSTKCISAVGGVYSGFHALNDFTEGKWFAASLKVAISAGCFELYRIFDRNGEEVSRRMKKTEAYLEDKMRDEYGN